MPKIEPFEKHAREYEEWFAKNENVYKSELRLMEKLIVKGGYSLEVGVGTGKFGGPFEVSVGIDPSEEMLKRARKLGIKVIKGIAENLPFDNNEFDWVLMVVSICFVDDPLKTFSEIHRVLKKEGKVITGYIDKESPLGKIYEKNKEKSKFYKPATFFSTKEIVKMFERSGFKIDKIYQTIFELPSKNYKIEDPKEGYGEGSFIGISAVKT